MRALSAAIALALRLRLARGFKFFCGPRRSPRSLAT